MNSQLRTTHLSKEPIAITGISCRFPKVSNLDQFWELLVRGEDTIDEIKRWNIDEYFDSDKTAKNKTHQRHSSLFDNLDDFDPFFFNISPAEAAEMTPSQKLLLELAWEAIENSSIPVDKVMGQKAGVYIGNIWSDFEHLRKHKNAEITLHSSVGQSSNVIANRVSYFLGLTGPSLIVDTGCSTSLVALHLACQGLWEGNIKFALAGGINHILDPDQNLLLSKFGGLSAKGTCSTFDANVDGFVRGEGAGLLLLKRLSDAERDGDHIYAVIRGTAMNNNGFNINLPATSTKGQLDVLAEAYANTGIDPKDVHYVETHGTGTKLGDPTECNAIGHFFGQNRTQPLAIGSVKTNLGHTEGAAGMAGLIKTVLAMNHRLLPKNLNFKTPNPEIDFEGLQLKVQKENTEWPTSGEETLKAGINSFGWGGTNAHTLIEEYKSSGEEKNQEANLTHDQLVLPLSAKSESALKEYVEQFSSHFEHLSDDQAFANSLVSTAIRKPKLSHGKLFWGKDKEDVLTALKEFSKTDEVESVEMDTSKVVFVFPGQGSQWAGMGKELYRKEPVFKQAIDDCEEAFRPFVDWSLTEQIHEDEEHSRLKKEISVIQPALFAMQVSLAKLWMSFGVKPDSVVGHSMGEVAAAYISGALNLTDAANIICTRSRLMQTVSGQGGAMAVTELTVAQAEDHIKQYKGLSIAVNNSPKSTVIAGDQQEITRLLDTLEAKGLFCKQVKVDVASHSKQMDPLKDELRAAIETITPQDNSIDLFSTVRDMQIEGKALNPEYWVDNLRQSVKFASTTERLLKENHNIFIEVSPHPVLVTAIQECFEAFDKKGIASPTLLRNKP
ncbi:MAG: type I polyketide synthase, partial [Bacteroidota bacterium]